MFSNDIYNLHPYRHWRHLQKGKEVKKYKGEVYRSTGARGVIADVLGIANITDIVDVADIVTDIADIAADIADIADIVNIADIVVETGRRLQGVTKVSRNRV